MNDGDYNFAGCGAGYYNITFWAKAKEIPAGSTAVFSVGFNSKNHLMKSEVARYTQYSDYDTFINGADGAPSSIKMTEEWQKYSVTIKVEEDWLKMEMTILWDEFDDGVYRPQLTRNYDDFWWCTGFSVILS